MGNLQPSEAAAPSMNKFGWFLFLFLPAHFHARICFFLSFMILAGLSIDLAGSSFILLLSDSFEAENVSLRESQQASKQAAKQKT